MGALVSESKKFIMGLGLFGLLFLKVKSHGFIGRFYILVLALFCLSETHLILFDFVETLGFD